MIQVKEAQKRLGMCDKPSSIYISKKWQPYLVRIEGKRQGTLFDWDRYVKETEFIESLINDTTFLVQYLKHECNITYSDMARKIGTSAQQIAQFEWGINFASNIIKTLIINYEQECLGYEKYYNTSLEKYKDLK